MMILPSDNVYQQTRLIKQGKAAFPPDFQPLAEWIKETYGVKPINIVYNTIENSERPRLEVCFEFEAEKAKFLDNNQFAPDTEKQQAIAEQFGKIVEAKKAMVMVGAGHGAGFSDYNPEGVWVIYSAFDRVAKMEANENIPQADIDALQKELANNDLWCISRMFSAATFFVYTDEQLEVYNHSGIKEAWAKKYFQLLKQYDPFDYVKEDNFFIYLDSKENFDTNYDSNWYYYYK
ncbi:MAG: hypothetical protein IT270_01995 [Saprospiraceae bacterium]|nr:hypothetical protein [Saprospiraceae bacterium]